MPRAEVSPSLVCWARDRAGNLMEVLAERFTKLPEWEPGTSTPTLKDVEAMAKATLTPVGHFLLPEPPVEALPLPAVRNAHHVAP